MSEKPTILVLGKLPPPLIGPAIATDIILNSRLNQEFNLLHLDTRLNTDVATMGRWSFSKLFKTRTLHKKYKAMLVEHKPDLVLIPISQTSMGFLKDYPFLKIAHKQGIKTVVQLRGSNFLNWINSSSTWIQKTVRKGLGMAEGVIVLGENLRYLFEDYFPKNRIFVVSNGANYRLENSRSDELEILYLANFLPSKGFDDVLEAVVLLKEKGITNFRLNAAGAWDNPNFKKKCTEIIADNNLANVDLLLPVSGKDKMQLLANASIFVFCPRMPEGHPWVIVEALANALPVLATDQGAIVESVLHENNGYIVPANDPEAIAIHLEKLIGDANLRGQFSTASLVHYRNNFTEEKMVEQLSKVFKTLI